jgi:hypothetical protein
MKSSVTAALAAIRADALPGACVGRVGEAQKL